MSETPREMLRGAEAKALRAPTKTEITTKYDQRISKITARQAKLSAQIDRLDTEKSRLQGERSRWGK